jgi:hypothetical protein
VSDGHARASHAPHSGRVGGERGSGYAIEGWCRGLGGSSRGGPRNEHSHANDYRADESDRDPVAAAQVAQRTGPGGSV